MLADANLVRRSGDLKGELLDFARRRRFARPFRQALEGRFEGRTRVDEGDFANFLDYFVLQHRLPDGQTVVEHFVAEHPERPAEERALLLGWRDVVEGIFEVGRREGDALIAVNLVDELTYRLRSNAGPAAFAGIRPGSFLISRLVPIGDEWLLSGVSGVLPAASQDEAARLAASLASRHPALVFRNPEKLAQAWELQREERRDFIAFFGSDLVVLPGSELAERLGAYAHFRSYERRDATGKSAAERAAEIYGAVPPVPELELPAELSEAETVGVIFDETDGLHFFADFGRVEATFDRPELAADPSHRQAVLGYLKEPSIPPLPLRRLAERDPERAGAVFRRVLRRPDFAWERDGEALLRRYKAEYFERPALPGVTPLSERLTRAQIGAPAAGTSPGDRASRPRRSSRKPPGGSEGHG